MSLQQLLDSLPVGGFFMAFAVVALFTFEGGYRQGHWRQKRSPDEIKGPTSMIVSSLLALMGFLLAISMGMAADRFDTRRGLVLTEANSVGTTYLRAGYLPEPAASDVQSLLREYVPLRIANNSMADAQAQINRSVELHTQLWSIAEELARSTPESDVLALFIVSLNDMIDVHLTRITAGIYARVPETVFLLLLLGSMLTLGMVGYNAGLTRRRSPLTAFVLIIVLGSVIALIVDIDRGQDGFIKVDQRPLLILQEQIGATPG